MLVVFLGLVVSFSQLKIITSDSHEYKLVNHLLTNYNPIPRPSLNHSKPTDVTFHLSLSKIIDVDEKHQIITTNCWIAMHWIDNKLSWNPAEFDEIGEIRIPHDNVWKPDITLYNSADYDEDSILISSFVIVQSNGNVTWLSKSIYRSTCSIDVEFFPFDTQNCSLSFASWAYDGNGVNFLQSHNDGDTSNYVPNGGWHLERLLIERGFRLYSCCPVAYPNITYYIVIQRRPLFFVFSMILPSILITIVGFFGFLISPDTGEKVNLGVTTLLSMVVFLMAVVENMPPNAETVPVIGIFYLGSMIIISLALMSTVLTLNIYKRGENGEPVPRAVQTIFFDIFAKLLFVRIKVNRDVNLSVKEAFEMNQAYIAYVKKLKKWSTRKRQQKMPERSRSTLKELKSIISGFNSSSRNNHLPSNTDLSGPQTNQLSDDQTISEHLKPQIEQHQQYSSFNKINRNEQEENLVDLKRIGVLLEELILKLNTSDSKDIFSLYKQEIQNQWTQLSRVFDVLFWYMFVSSWIAFLVFLWFKIPNNSLLRAT